MLGLSMLDDPEEELSYGVRMTKDEMDFLLKLVKREMSLSEAKLLNVARTCEDLAYHQKLVGIYCKILYTDGVVRY